MAGVRALGARRGPLAAFQALPAEIAAYLAERAERSKLATVPERGRLRIAAAYRAAGQLDPTKTQIVADMAAWHVQHRSHPTPENPRHAAVIAIPLVPS